MATRKAVMATLTMLAREYAGTVTEEKADIWLAALEDVPDAALPAAVAKVIKTHTGGFIPPVALLREAAGANTKARVDVVTIRRQIIEAVGYNPHGFQAPRVEFVRARFGDGIADAYAAVGARFFDGGTTGQIAERDFGQEMEAIVAERGAACLALPAVSAPVAPRLTSGEAPAAPETPLVEPFDWRAALKGAFTRPKPDLAKFEVAAAAGDALAAKYLERKRRVVA